MCRWLAYSGPEIYMDRLLIQPRHSLLMQSRFARMNYVSGMPDFPDGAFPTNGDGFGFGWYSERPSPGVYRELRPAWSDENFTSLARQIRSGLFMAHLRAAYDGVVQRTNSHPFHHGRWMMQHNGEVVDFQRMRRELMLELQADYFNEIKGTTDTEVLFYLALEYGMAADPQGGLQRMAGRVERAREELDIEGPLRLTCVASDGEALYGVRYSSDANSKTLFINRGVDALRQLEGEPDDIPDSGIILLSEPLDDCTEHWQPIDEGTFVEITDGQVRFERFVPERP